MFAMSRIHSRKSVKCPCIGLNTNDFSIVIGAAVLNFIERVSKHSNAYSNIHQNPFELAVISAKCCDPFMVKMWIRGSLVFLSNWFELEKCRTKHNLFILDFIMDRLICSILLAFTQHLYVMHKFIAYSHSWIFFRCSEWTFMHLYFKST